MQEETNTTSTISTLPYATLSIFERCKRREEYGGIRMPSMAVVGTSLFHFRSSALQTQTAFYIP